MDFNGVNPKELEVSTEDVMRMMKFKALGFDVLFYMLCFDPKSGKIKYPRNTSKYKRDDYKRILDMFQETGLQLQDKKTLALFKRNMETYVDYLVKQLGSPIKVVTSEPKDILDQR
jgi:hypothetical protein